MKLPSRPTKPTLKLKPKPISQEELEEETLEALAYGGADIKYLERKGPSPIEYHKIPYQVKAACMTLVRLGIAKNELNELVTFRLEQSGASDLEKELCNTAWNAVCQLFRMYDEKLKLQTKEETS